MCSRYNNIYLIGLLAGLNEPNALEPPAEVLDIASASKCEVFLAVGRGDFTVCVYFYLLALSQRLTLFSALL